MLQHMIPRHSGQCYDVNFVFWGKLFPIPAWMCLSAQSKVHKDMFEWVWFGRTWLAHTEPWPQLHWTLLGWTGMETVNQDFLAKISAWPHKCSIGWMVNGFCGKPSQKSGRCYSYKGETNSILMSMYFKCSVIKVPFGMVRCSNTFVNIV